MIERRKLLQRRRMLSFDQGQLIPKIGIFVPGPAQGSNRVQRLSVDQLRLARQQPVSLGLHFQEHMLQQCDALRIDLCGR